MYKLKRLLLVAPVIAVLLMLLISLFSTPVYAQARYGYTFTPVTTDTASVLGAGTWVYGAGIYTKVAAGHIGLYDVATVGEATDAELSAPEVGHATQYMCEFLFYDKPIYFSTAVTAIVGGNIGMVVSGPEPD